MKLRASYENVLQMAKNAKGDDKEGYKAEFIKMVEMARTVSSAAVLNTVK